MDDLSSEQVQEILDLVYQGQKIQAISRYRELRNCGLLEAKQFVEQLSSELIERSPEEFRKSNAGCASIILVLLASSLFGIGATSCVMIAWG